MPVTKCVCENITFKELKQVAKQENISSLAELKDVVQVATGCGLCALYIKQMLRTGQTEFDL